MDLPAAFNISCPTSLRFGVDRLADLASLVAPGARVVLVQGAGDAAAPVHSALAGCTVQVVRCGAEPSVDAVNAALAQIATRPDVVVACGGGSVMDMAKALAVLAEAGVTLPDDFAAIDPGVLAHRSHIRLIALPTTAGTGAEVTGNAVIDVPAKGAKISLRGQAVFPDIAIIDPQLMAGAPPRVALYAGLDALTQVVEAHTSRFATPFTLALTAQTVPMALGALPRVVAGGTLDDWSQMAWASLASGLALANGGLGAAHGLASVLGARFGAPHGALCGRLLVPVLRANRAVADGNAAARLLQCQDWIAQAFPPTDDDPMSGLARWCDGQGLPRLAHYGLEQEQIADLATQGAAASSSQKNAVALPPAAYVEILHGAL